MQTKLFATIAVYSPLLGKTLFAKGCALSTNFLSVSYTVAYRRWHQEVGNQLPNCQYIGFLQVDGERVTLGSLATRRMSIGANRASL